MVYQTIKIWTQITTVFLIFMKLMEATLIKMVLLERVRRLLMRRVCQWLPMVDQATVKLIPMVMAALIIKI